jgi:hypothetical protein
MNKYE